jgi:hypothetical protein
MILKYIKLFEELNSDSQKDQVIDEIYRLIWINHKLDGNPSVLSDIYDKGYEMGSIYKKSKGGKAFSEMRFNIDKDIIDRAKELNPKRIGNDTDLKYNGPEITSNRILSGDHNVEDSLKLLSDPYSDYMGITHKTPEQHQIDMEQAIEDDKIDGENEAEYIENKYNCSEVQMLLLKLYQIGFSIGEEEAETMPRDVKKYFSWISMVNSMIQDKEKGRGDIPQEEIDDMVGKLDNLRKSFYDNGIDYEKWEKYYTD